VNSRIKNSTQTHADWAAGEQAWTDPRRYRYWSFYHHREHQSPFHYALASRGHRGFF